MYGISNISSGYRWFVAVLSSALYRFYWDDCFSRAAALAYTTLFALVPVTALSFSMFSAFGIGSADVSRALNAILEQILPPVQNNQLLELQHDILKHLELFSQNVKALNIVSFGVLVFTCIALLNTIESALNVVWRTSSNLSLLAKVTSFWTVLTLGPLLVMLSIYWTTSIRVYGVTEEYTYLYVFAVAYIVPASVTWVGLTLLFYKLPAARVRLWDAMFGALISAMLFEVIKRGFAYYIGLSTTYSAIYGVLATIPLFLFWLYVTWAVVLFGAEIGYQSGSIHILSGLRRYRTELGEAGVLFGLRILLNIGENFLEGKSPPSEGEIAIETGSDPVLVRQCLNVFSQSGILSNPDEESHARGLIVSPEKLTLGRIFELFRTKEDRARRARNLGEEGSEQFLDLMHRASQRFGPNRNAIDWSLAELLELSVEQKTSSESRKPDERGPFRLA